MLTVHCPHCGARPETEFRHGGHAGIRRPFVDRFVTHGEFADYLFVRRIESDGRLLERWCHVAGCGQWFTAHRDLRTDTEATTA
jgi:sarcosine oxidase subunit delta